jgi:hypothetical protein
MAVRYAVATGNWSDTATWNGGTLPTSADDVYSNGFTVTIDQNITVQSLRNNAQSPAIAGGGFQLNDGYTIDCLNSTVGIIGNSSTKEVVTYSGTASANINAKIGMNVNRYCVLHNGTGTLNIVGDIVAQSLAGTNGPGGVSLNSSGVLNLVGDIYAPTNDMHYMLSISGTGTCNHTGNIANNASGSTDRTHVFVGASSRYNLTGNVNSSMRNITGTYNGTSIVTSSASVVNITGSVSAIRGRVIESTAAMTLSIVGAITANASSDTANINPPIFDNQQGSLIAFSGPFICGAWGNMPFSVTRMHLIPSSSSYFQFPDNSTNGQNTPTVPAPTTRLVSPGSAVDAPIPSDVRHDVVYALGTQRGSLKVPSPDSVAKGVPTDNTVGNAVLTPDAVWNYATANLTDTNSIGARLKNVSTVETTGEQLEALL